MKFRFLSILFVAILLVSCKKEKLETVYLDDEIPTAATDSVTVSASEVTQPSASGLNPEHGQPGHRCDIPVGSPLNASSNNSVLPPSLQQPSVINQAPITPSTPSTAGVNPEHGQPGHRCDIPVGAPLS